MSADGGVVWRTREAFFHRATAIGAWLAENGVRPREPCLVVLPTDELAATVLHALLLSGAVPLLMAPPNAPGQRERFLAVLHGVFRKSRPGAVIVHQSLRALQDELVRKVPRARVRFISSELLDVAAVSHMSIVTGELVAMQMTSGTTGNPKICLWRQDQLLAGLHFTANAIGLDENDVLFNWTPLYHDLGLVNNFLLCLSRGVPLVMLNPLLFVERPARWLQGMCATRATMSFAPNFGFARAAHVVRDEELDGITLEGVRALWSAAERVHPETMDRFHRRFAPFGLQRRALKTSYGLAENVGGATFSPLEHEYTVERVERKALNTRGIARRWGEKSDVEPTTIAGVGRACEGIAVEIRSRSGKVLPDGQVGEIVIRSPSRMVGYVRAAKQTRAMFRGPWLKTGDLGYMRDGELYWVGRVREQISVRGRKYDPSEFEEILLRIPGLREGCFVAFGVDDPAHGTQEVVVISEVRKTAGRPASEIRAEIKKLVYQQIGIVLRRIVLVPQGTLAKTSSGKRRHRFYRERYAAGEFEAVELKSSAE